MKGFIVRLYYQVPVPTTDMLRGLRAASLTPKALATLFTELHASLQLAKLACSKSDWANRWRN